MSGRDGRGGGDRAGQPSLLAQPLRPPSAARAVLYLGLLLLGALVGIAGALIQPGWFPGGLLLALAAEAGLCVGAGRAVGRRAGAAVPAAGWAIAVVLLTTSRPEGDFLFAAGSGSYLFLLGGIALAVMCATLAPVGRPSGDRARRGD